MARNVTDEVNAYEEDIERVVGIYAPHLGSELVRVTRTAEWRIVSKLLAVEPLTLKSGIAAPRSPVNNCGLYTSEVARKMTSTPSEQAAAVLNLIGVGAVDWKDPDIVKVLSDALKAGAKPQNRKQRNRSPLKQDELAPSARLTKSQRDQISKIQFDLVQHRISPERWELDVLARGATVIYNGTPFSYPIIEDWHRV